MATLAHSFYERPQGQKTSPADPWRLRPFPMEDVHFFQKKIDNTRVVRTADPQEQRAGWKFIGGACGAAVLLIGLLLPTGYNMIAGFQLQSLLQERERLLNERATLELEEARLLSPERLEELARMQQYIDPEPGSVVYLPKAGESAAVRRPAAASIDGQ